MFAQEISTRGRFHKPIYALRQAFTLCAELLRLKKASQKLGAERKSLAQSVNGFMKSTQDLPWQRDANFIGLKRWWQLLTFGFT